MDYANGKIYKIVCNITGEVYIGSTTQPLAKRLAVHKYKGQKCSSNQIISRGNYVIVLIEAFPCENKSELFQRERYHYDLIPNINRNRPFRTNEEHIEAKATSNKARYEANTQAILAKAKVYNEANKETITKYQKAYFETNKEAIAKYHKAYYQAKKATANQPS
jgi:hypothetical protein